MNFMDMLTSKTLWGLVIGVGAQLAARHGLVFDPNAVTVDVVSLVGTALAIYGRLTVKKSMNGEVQ